MKNWSLCVAAAIVLIATAAPAGAAPASSTTSWGTSYVDVDNDGVRDSGEPALSSVITPNLGFYSWQSGPNWTAKTGPVGLVLEGPITLNTAEWLNFGVRGDITLKGSLIAKKPDTNVRFLTIGTDNDITLAPYSVIKGNGDVNFQSVTNTNEPAGVLRVGEGSLLEAKGEFQGIELRADTVNVASGVKFAVKGGGYNDVWIRSNELNVAEGVVFTGSSHGGIHIVVRGDLTLSKVIMKAGYIFITAWADQSEGDPPRRLKILNSMLTQTYRNGHLELEAYPGANGQFASNALDLTGTTYSAKGVLWIWPE